MRTTLFLNQEHLRSLRKVWNTTVGFMKINDVINDILMHINNTVNKPVVLLLYFINLIILQGYRVLLSPTLKLSNNINPNISDIIIDTNN